MKLAMKLLTATFVIGAIGAAALPAEAAPIAAQAGLQNAPGSQVQTVQWRGEGDPRSTQYGSDYQYYGPRYGSGSGYYQSNPGYYSGAAVGTQYGPNYDNYGPGSSSGYSSFGSAYDSYAYSPGGVGVGRDQAYCQQRFRSFDPASGTYMGFDGRRHPCP